MQPPPAQRNGAGSGRGRTKSPALAAVLSLAPGLGHWYVGKTRKAVALGFMDAGMLLAVTLFHSRLTYMLTAFVYLATMAPAMFEAWSTAKSGRAGFDMDSKPYVIAMLLVTGFNALPLLWQSRSFSRHAKIMWTIAVPTLAALFFVSLWVWRAHIEDFLKGF